MAAALVCLRDGDFQCSVWMEYIGFEGPFVRLAWLSDELHRLLNGCASNETWRAFNRITASAFDGLTDEQVLLNAKFVEFVRPIVLDEDV